MRELHTRLRFFPAFKALTILLALLILQACGTGGGYSSQPWDNSANRSRPAQQVPSDISQDAADDYAAPAPVEGEVLDENTSGLPPVKVAILLPLTGEHAKLGEAMLNASQMALFDVGFSHFELLPKDTMGTAQGARAAAQSAVNDGAKLVIGPVFSHSVRAASQVTQAAGINMVAFSTDWKLANKSTYLIGFLPFDQIERVVRYASGNSLKRIGVLSPTDTYGDGVVSAYNAISRSAGVNTSRVERFAPQGNDLTSVVRTFANHDARQAGNDTSMPFDAVLMPVGGPLARQVGSFLSHYDLPPAQVKRLGTGLMDDPSLASDSTLAGAWFAAPDPQSRTKFERRYSSVYNTTPPRISSLAYDATALAAILARMGMKEDNRMPFDARAITNPNGFSGVDGIFRFRNDGIVERGLAVLEYRNGRIIVIDQPPKTFQRGAY